MSGTPADRMVTRPFLTVVGACFAFFIYVGVNIPLIPLLIEHRLGGHEFDIGLAVGIFSAAAIAARPALGRFGERYGLRRMMVVGALIASVAALASTLARSLWVLMLLRGTQGIGEAALFVGGATLINEFAPSHRRAEAASYFSVAVFGGIGIGPIISQYVVGKDRYSLGLVVAAVFAAIGAALCSFAPRGNVVDPEASIGQPRYHRAALLPGMVLALGIAGFATFNAFVPSQAEDLGMKGAAWVFGTYSVICLVLRLAGARVPEKIGLPKAVTCALIGIAVGLATLGIIQRPIGLYIGAAVLAVGVSFNYPALLTLAVNSVPDNERVRLIATFTMFFELGSAVGGISFGALAEATSKRGGFLGGSAAALLGLLVLWKVLMPAMRRRPISASAVSPSPAQ